MKFLKSVQMLAIFCCSILAATAQNSTTKNSAHFTKDFGFMVGEFMLHGDKGSFNGRLTENASDSAFIWIIKNDERSTSGIVRFSKDSGMYTSTYFPSTKQSLYYGNRVENKIVLYQVYPISGTKRNDSLKIIFEEGKDGKSFSYSREKISQSWEHIDYKYLFFYRDYSNTDKLNFSRNAMRNAGWLSGKTYAGGYNTASPAKWNADSTELKIYFKKEARNFEAAIVYNFETDRSTLTLNTTQGKNTTTEKYTGWCSSIECKFTSDSNNNAGKKATIDFKFLHKGNFKVEQN